MLGTAFRAFISLIVCGFSQPLLADAKGGSVDQAFHFAFPVYQFALTRERAAQGMAKAGVQPLNRFAHKTKLATAADRAVTTPNNDTLYSSAWLDLRHGPVILTMPALPDRYHSVALMSPLTDNFAVLGSRDGGSGGRYALVGPGWRGAVPNGATLVRAPFNDVWALARILVEGQDDLPAAIAAQARFALAETAKADRSGFVPAVLDDATPAAFLDSVNAFLARSPLPPTFAREARRLRKFGIAPGRSGVFATLDPSIRAEWTTRYAELKTELRDAMPRFADVIDGWSYPRPGIGEFGDDFFYRSAIALTGLAALPRSEAIYLTAHGDGMTCRTLRVPPSVPLRRGGFWSLTLYESMPDGRQFFFPNEAGIYSIGDRSPGLARARDGSVSISICPTRQGADNWLPAPSGKWSLTFRMYMPDRSVLTGRWRLLPLQ